MKLSVNRTLEDVLKKGALQRYFHDRWDGRCHSDAIRVEQVNVVDSYWYWKVYTAFVETYLLYYSTHLLNYLPYFRYMTAYIPDVPYIRHSASYIVLVVTGIAYILACCWLHAHWKWVIRWFYKWVSKLVDVFRPMLSKLFAYIADALVSILRRQSVRISKPKRTFTRDQLNDGVNSLVIADIGSRQLVVARVELKRGMRSVRIVKYKCENREGRVCGDDKPHRSVVRHLRRANEESGGNSEYAPGAERQGKLWQPYFRVANNSEDAAALSVGIRGYVRRSKERPRARFRGFLGFPGKSRRCLRNSMKSTGHFDYLWNFPASVAALAPTPNY